MKSPVGDVSLGKEALTAIAGKPGGTLEVIIADAGQTDAIAIRNNEFTLTVKVGGTEIKELGGEAAVALPYAKAADEDAELLTVYKIGEGGTYIEVKGARYDAASGKAVFTTSETGAYIVSEWISPFGDMAKGEWYYKAARYAYSNGFMTGVTDEAFAPQTALTRAMLITILAREAGVDTGGGEIWYSRALEWGVASGITDGVNPNGEITREQFAAMLYRRAGSPAADGNLAGYDDAGSVSSWAADAMAWAVSNGIITGRAETTLAPKGKATRGEAAALLQRFLEGRQGQM